MEFVYNTEEEAVAAYEAWVNAATPRVSDTDSRQVTGVRRNGLTVDIDIATPAEMFDGRTWTPLQIKRLFTPQEWAAAKAIAVDTWEDMALTFDPIPSALMLGHLRALVTANVLDPERFEVITGRAF